MQHIDSVAIWNHVPCLDTLLVGSDSAICNAEVFEQHIQQVSFYLNITNTAFPYNYKASHPTGLAKEKVDVCERTSNPQAL